MRQGCGIAFGVVLLLLLAAGAALAFLLHGAGVLESFPPQDTASVVQASPAVVLHVDLVPAKMRDLPFALLDEAPDWRTRFLLGSLPWRGTFALDLDSEARKVNMTAAFGLRRLSGLVASRASKDIWRWFDGQKVESLALEQPGLWVARSTLPIREQAQAEAGARWPVKSNSPLAPPADGPIAFHLDNRDGGAFLALEPILNPPPQPGTEITGKPPVLDARGWAAYFERLEQASGAVSLEDAGAAVATVRVQARNALAARELRALLERERDRVAAWLEGYGAYLEGHWTLEGATISGDFRVERAVSLARAAVQGDQP